MKIGLIGDGKMAKAVEKQAALQQATIAFCATPSLPLSECPLEQADVLVDFSVPECALDHIASAVRAKKPLVVGTTGWDKQLEQAQALVRKEKGTVLFSPNFSIGIYIFLNILRQAKELFTHTAHPFSLQGIEMHHGEKKDTPSGTAKAICAIFDDQIDFSCIRLGHLLGTHTLIADGPFETITLTHTAKNRDGFAIGALVAAKWILDKQGWYTIHDMFQSIYSPHHPL